MLVRQQSKVRTWGTRPIARAWAALMRRLGYDKYVAAGNDWGLAYHPNWADTHPAPFVESS